MCGYGFSTGQLRLHLHKPILRGLSTGLKAPADPFSTGSLGKNMKKPKIKESKESFSGPLALPPGDAAAVEEAPEEQGKDTSTKATLEKQL